jgi:hypothetical protein
MILAVGTAGICLATAVVYLADTEAPEPVGVWLGTLGLLGASGLAAAGLWQQRSEAIPRLFALVLLSGLAAMYVAANVFALFVVPETELDGAPRVLHVAGLVAGIALYLLALWESTRAFTAGRRPVEPVEMPDAR